MLGKLNFHLDLPTPLRKPQVQRALLLWHCAILEERGCSQSVTIPLTLTMQSFLVSVVQEAASASSPCFRISQWCISCEQLLVGLLVRGTEVRNILCHHLDDLTLNLGFLLQFDVSPLHISVSIVSQSTLAYYLYLRTMPSLPFSEISEGQGNMMCSLALLPLNSKHCLLAYIISIINIPSETRELHNMEQL